MYLYSFNFVLYVCVCVFTYLYLPICDLQGPSLALYVLSLCPYLSSLSFIWLTLSAHTTSLLSLFHLSMPRYGKLYFLTSPIQLSLWTVLCYYTWKLCVGSVYTSSVTSVPPLSMMYGTNLTAVSKRRDEWISSLTAWWRDVSPSFPTPAKQDEPQGITDCSVVMTLWHNWRQRGQHWRAGVNLAVESPALSDGVQFDGWEENCAK